jgi:hypothetical protein
VGERIGTALRRSVPDKGAPGSATDSGRGPLEGERSRVVRWLPPILVNADAPANLPVAVRPVNNP